MFVRQGFNVYTCLWTQENMSTLYTDICIQFWKDSHFNFHFQYSVGTVCKISYMWLSHDIFSNLFNSTNLKLFEYKG